MEIQSGMMSLIRAIPVLVFLASAPISFSSAPVHIGRDALLPDDPRQEYARYVRFRPADGQVVNLNPPRISWPYVPEIFFKDSEVPATQRFTLQIADNPDFANPVVEVKDTPYNFYNFLPPLGTSGKWYWRIGYNLNTPDARWSGVRTFLVDRDAVEWDRSRFHELIGEVKGHPRILFNRENYDKMLALKDRNDLSRAYAEDIIREADAVLRSRQYREFPDNDNASINYMELSDSLVHLGFARLLTGDEKYAGFKERALAMAGWPPGGKSSPEGLGQSLKWNTHVTEHLGLLYDWFYDEWTETEREVLKNCIEWRLDWTLNDFAWKQRDGKVVKRGSIAAACSSHPYQNIMAILPGALAICDESIIAREVLECGLHYLIGITNGHGEDEGWHDGPGYGNGKMKWLTNASWCLQSAIPELQLGKNPAYSNYMDFFARITPVGAEHSSFGNRGINELDWVSSRIMNSIRVAMLCNDGNTMRNWIDSRKRMQDLNHDGLFSESPYIDYVMPLYAAVPEPAAESDTVGLFASEGWITVSSAPPSDYAAQKNAVSMTFACRPRGGFGHSFRNENAFDIHAYGETIATGGGSTSNQSNFANDTMSHNSVLVNGMEQGAARDNNIPACGRVIAFHRGDNHVYWAGDATAAYGSRSGLENFTRHVLFVDNAYFVIFDELSMRPGHDPATFQWLYHIPKPDSIELRDGGNVFYRIGKARVLLRQIAGPDELDVRHYKAGEGMLNRITGKDYRIPDAGQLREVERKISFGSNSAKLPAAVDVDHLWFSNRTPSTRTTFLAVIVPYGQDDDSPKVAATGKSGVTVTFRGRSTSVSFSGDPQADICINIDEI